MITLTDNFIISLINEGLETSIGAIVENQLMPPETDEQYLDFEPRNGWALTDRSAIENGYYGNAPIKNYENADRTIVVTIAETRFDPIHIRGNGWAIKTTSRFDEYTNDESPVPEAFSTSAHAKTDPNVSQAVQLPENGWLEGSPSWPRKASPDLLNLQPDWEGEFNSFQDWVNFAAQRLSPPINDNGSEVPAICIDRFGRRCVVGADFMRARDESAFPIRYFFQCKPA